eukprot:1148596-Pelagomonas_calceolata.AAC.7
MLTYGKNLLHRVEQDVSGNYAKARAKAQQCLRKLRRGGLGVQEGQKQSSVPIGLGAISGKLWKVHLSSLSVGHMLAKALKSCKLQFSGAHVGKVALLFLGALPAKMH